MIQYGHKHGAIGVLNTDWGDMGHINFLANSIPGMILGADLSWNTREDMDQHDIEDSISILEYGDYTKRLVGVLREAGRAKSTDWSKILLWTYSNIYAMKEDWYDVNFILQLTEEELICSHNHVVELQKELLEISAKVYKARRADMEEFKLSLLGIGYFHSLVLNIKKYHYKENIENTIYLSDNLAVLLEYWMEEFSRVWRLRNKESEFHRIREIVFKLCDYLRDCKKSIGKL
jgi:hypothetical protein